MTILLIILLVLAVVWFYYRQQLSTDHSAFNGSSDTALSSQLAAEKSANQALITFLRTSLNSNSLEELKTKLGEKSLNELIEENEDYETEIDTLTRTKNSLEADLLAQSNAFQARLKEKDREVKKAKTDLNDEKKRAESIQNKLTSEKQQHKGSLARIKLLTEQITKLEKEQQKLAEQVKKMPGEFPTENKEHQVQLRKIYALFDLRAKGMKVIEFEKLYELLQKISSKVDLNKIDR